MSKFPKNYYFYNFVQTIMNKILYTIVTKFGKLWLFKIKTYKQTLQIKATKQNYKKLTIISCNLVVKQLVVMATVNAWLSKDLVKASC